MIRIIFNKAKKKLLKNIALFILKRLINTPSFRTGNNGMVAWKTIQVKNF